MKNMKNIKIINSLLELVKVKSRNRNKTNYNKTISKLLLGLVLQKMKGYKKKNQIKKMKRGPKTKSNIEIYTPAVRIREYNH